MQRHSGSTKVCRKCDPEKDVGEFYKTNRGTPRSYCKICMKTVDHVVPLSRDGTNTIDNLQPLCFPCNAKKGVRIIDYRPDVCIVEPFPQP